jgi:hypothetical protein
MEFIEYSLSNKSMMTKASEEKCIEYLKTEFQFFKDLSKIGADLQQMMQHLHFMRSLEVKTLCTEGMKTDSG